jgi:N6-adenosine-specific RNA methylase IME4
MRRQAKLLANFLGAAKELTSEYVGLAEITDDEQNQIRLGLVARPELKDTVRRLVARGHTLHEIAEDTGWSIATIKRISAKLNPPKPVSNDTKPASKETTTERAATQERAADVAAAAEAEGTTPEPTEKYRIVYADPPWSYDDTILVPHRRGLPVGEAAEHYPTMELAAICALPVKDWVEDNAVLFLWVTAPMAAKAMQVVSAWGFSYKAQFIWDKIKHNMGHYNSVRHELLFICTRGSCEPDKQQLFDSVQSIERGKHSEKPVKFYDIIETLYTHGRKLEMFARAKRDGWDVYGLVAEFKEAAE